MSKVVRVPKVQKFSKEKGVILFEVADTLKGRTPEGTTFKHVIGTEGARTKPIYDWLAAGKQAMMFTIEAAPNGIACGYVFLD